MSATSTPLTFGEIFTKVLKLHGQGQRLARVLLHPDDAKGVIQSLGMLAPPNTDLDAASLPTYGEIGKAGGVVFFVDATVAMGKPLFAWEWD